MSLQTSSRKPLAQVKLTSFADGPVQLGGRLSITKEPQNLKKSVEANGFRITNSLRQHFMCIHSNSILNASLPSTQKSECGLILLRQLNAHELDYR